MASKMSPSVLYNFKIYNVVPIIKVRAFSHKYVCMYGKLYVRVTLMNVIRFGCCFYYFYYFFSFLCCPVFVTVRATRDHDYVN